MQNVRNKKIAITGVIGSGKSLVSKLIREKGIDVFDVDAYNKSLLNDHEVLKLLSENFKDDLKGQSLNKDLLREIVFNNSDKKKQLENIMHPLILKGMLKEMAEKDLFFAEVPLLYEAGWEMYFDEVIVVYANETDIKLRLVERGLNDDMINKILDSQINQVIKVEKADHVFYNTKGIEDLKNNVEEWLKEHIYE